jgi:hypothetical protein
MAERPTTSAESPAVSRREFLTRGLRQRAAAVLAPGAAGAAAPPAEPGPPPALPPGALRRQSRAEVRAALARIRARRRTS